MGQRIVITEVSIAKLLKMERLRGRRIQGIDNKSPLIKYQVNKEIFTNYDEQRTDYKFKDLHPGLKFWQKIIQTCIHPRPVQNSADYINTTQKYILYCVMTKQKICLSFLLFNYLKEMVRRSRTTENKKHNAISYIPYGRLLSDIFVENGLVHHLEGANLTDDLSATYSDALTAKNLRHMGILKKVNVPLVDVPL